MARYEDPKESTGPPGDMVYILRKLNGWTISELAKRSGVVRSTIHRIEKNKERFTQKTLDKIAKEFNVSSICFFILKNYTEPIIKLINQNHSQKS